MSPSLLPAPLLTTSPSLSLSSSFDTTRSRGRSPGWGPRVSATATQCLQNAPSSAAGHVHDHAGCPSSSDSSTAYGTVPLTIARTLASPPPSCTTRPSSKYRTPRACTRSPASRSTSLAPNTSPSAIAMPQRYQTRHPARWTLTLAGQGSSIAFMQSAVRAATAA
jgi:hypothetical protein